MRSAFVSTSGIDRSLSEVNESLSNRWGEPAAGGQHNLILFGSCLKASIGLVLGVAFFGGGAFLGALPGGRPPLRVLYGRASLPVPVRAVFDASAFVAVVGVEVDVESSTWAADGAECG
eukprot:GHVN01007556.1.p1 GENE.GHVN01007556.1~~GHVN01007556.1.p1  ORF type:complete len:119 (+),score=28.84 GHVN01007556.1:26-382(+)